MRRALVIGIDDYSFGPLKGCVADASEMAGLLERNEDGSPNFDVRLLTAPSEPIERSTMRRAVTELFDKPAEVALLYFSGHGSENDLGGYLVTQDAKQYDEGVPMREIIDLANKSNVTEVVIIVDCCHSGYLGNSTGTRDANVKVEIREGVSIITASRASEPAMEVDGRGIFTALVGAALDGGAADVVGDVTVAGVFSHVDKSLGPWDQRPLFKSHVSSLLSLRKATPHVEPVLLRELTDYFGSATDEFALDPSFEVTHDHKIDANVTRYRTLVTYRDAHLIEVVSHSDLYFAAINSGTVRLTPLGRHYWKLAKEGRL